MSLSETGSPFRLRRRVKRLLKLMEGGVQSVAIHFEDLAFALVPGQDKRRSKIAGWWEGGERIWRSVVLIR